MQVKKEKTNEFETTSVPIRLDNLNISERQEFQQMNGKNYLFWL